MAQDIMLHVKNITAGYGKLQILNGMTLQVRRGSITAILGGNGCGKSTTLKAITGMLKVTSGEITFEGESLVGIRPQSVVRKGIAYVTQGKDVFPSMTVEENLLLGAYSIKSRQVIRDNCSFARKLQNSFVQFAKKRRLKGLQKSF